MLILIFNNSKSNRNWNSNIVYTASSKPKWIRTYSDHVSEYK